MEKMVIYSVYPNSGSISSFRFKRDLSALQNGNKYVQLFHRMGESWAHPILNASFIPLLGSLVI